MERTMSDWTSMEEARFTELQEELAELKARRDKARAQVDEMLSKLWDKDYEGVSADKMIEWADAVRDVLAPFDSGVRCVQEQQ
jgi:cyclopropane fatty-acyl-phospholipid synthase-like methyltransferase